MDNDDDDQAFTSVDDTKSLSNAEDIDTIEESVASRASSMTSIRSEQKMKDDDDNDQ